MSDLWSAWEKQPPTCHAAGVSPENVDRIACYYAEMGYRATVEREKDHVVLTLVKGEVMVTVPTGTVLICDDPPSVVSIEQFRRAWRREISQ